MKKLTLNTDHEISFGDFIFHYVNESISDDDGKIPASICITLLVLSEHYRNDNIKSSNIILAFLMHNTTMLPEQFKKLLWSQYPKRNIIYVRELLDIAKMHGLDTTRHDLHPNTLFRKFMETVVTNVRPEDVRNQMLSNNQKIRCKRLFKSLHISSGRKDIHDRIPKNKVMLHAIFTSELPIL